MEDREARTEETLDDLLRKDERRPSSVRRTLKMFQRQRWGNFWETGWSAYGPFQAHRYHHELNWTEVTEQPNAAPFYTCFFTFSGQLTSWSLSHFNPFTDVLAAPSLEKRPIEAPDLKSLSHLPLFAWTRKRISTKMHSTESRFVIGPSNILFAGVYVCTFYEARKIYKLGQLSG